MERKVTALKAQKRNPNRVSIYLDGMYAFGVTRLVAAWLHIGQEMTEAKIAELQKQEAQEVALQNALTLLSYRPRSEAEVRTRLNQKGYAEPVIDQVVERLRTTELLADNRFAQTWIENRSAFRPRSHRMLSMELRQKGVAEETIREALEQTVEDDELAYQVAITKARKLGDLEWAAFREKLGAFLLRRGFGYGTVSGVVRRVWSELQSGDTD